MGLRCIRMTLGIKVVLRLPGATTLICTYGNKLQTDAPRELVSKTHASPKGWRMLTRIVMVDL